MGALIWLASYPKSGNTWMRSFLHNLFRNSHQPVNINEIDDFCLGGSVVQWYRRYTSTPLQEMSDEETARYRMQVRSGTVRVPPIKRPRARAIAREPRPETSSALVRVGPTSARTLDAAVIST